MDIWVSSKGAYSFAPFLLDPIGRRLVCHGKTVKLPHKQFETLLYLVEHPAQVIEKGELLSAVWGGRIVEEGNLSQTVFLLRRALQAGGGANYIVTVPGRGYRFSIEVERFTPPASETAQPTPADEDAAFAQVFSQITQPAVAGLAGAEPKLRWPANSTLRRGAIAAAAIAMIASAIGLARHRTEETQVVLHAPPNAVAVLAFTNMSGDPRQEYFSDGVSEELTNTLGRVDGLQVAARMSAFTFKNSKVTIGEIARKLGVSAVLEGSVRRENTRLRITAQLIDADTGFQYWSHSYDREANGVLSLESEIAGKVAQSLRVTLLAGPGAKLTEGGTNNPQAFDAYLRGSSHMRFFSESETRAALPAFEEALRLDPSFANAYASHAFALTMVAIAWCNLPHCDFKLDRALAETDTAVSLAPNAAEAHAARGTVLMWQGNSRAADAELSLAHTLGPNDIMVGRSYSMFSAQIGRAEEAQAEARHIVALDPLTSAEYYRLGAILIWGREYREGLAALDRENALGAADSRRSRQLISMAHLGLSDWQAVVADCADNLVGYCSWNRVIAEQKLGRAADAQADLVLLQASGNGSDITYAAIYAQWGDRAAALHWLQAADQPGVRAADEVLRELRVNASLDPVRDTPEFKSLERHLELPPLHEADAR